MYESSQMSTALAAGALASPHESVSVVATESDGTFTHTSEEPDVFHCSISYGRRLPPESLMRKSLPSAEAKPSYEKPFTPSRKVMGVWKFSTVGPEYHVKLYVISLAANPAVASVAVASAVAAFCLRFIFVFPFSLSG